MLFRCQLIIGFAKRFIYILKCSKLGIMAKTGGISVKCLIYVKKDKSICAILLDFVLRVLYNVYNKL